MGVITITNAQAQHKIDNQSESDLGSDVDMSSELEQDQDEDQQNAANEGSLKGSGDVVTPGELLTDDPIWMRGHGTYAVDERLYASVAGTISRLNKLLTVKSLRGRYVPVIGDHVIGRITEVGNKRWKVDIGGNQDAVLLLGSVNLPGGVLRRKSESDELQMRQLLKEGDLLNAEVQALYSDGGAALHTRSLRYGKLKNGALVKVPTSLIIKLKTHVYQLPGGVDMILGINGYIWLRKSLNKANANENVSITRLEEEASLEIYSDANDKSITAEVRETISRYANCIQALAYMEVGINEARVIAAYDASFAYPSVGDLVENDVKQALAMEAMAA